MPLIKFKCIATNMKYTCPTKYENNAKQKKKQKKKQKSDTCNASLADRLAALETRTFARTETHMPT